MMGMGGVPRSHHGGQNWNCKLCGNVNYPDRMACNKCKDPREASQWRCESCGNWNWLDRHECNQCKAVPDEPSRKRPRTSPVNGHIAPRYKESISLPKNKAPGSNWICKSCNNTNFPDRLLCNRCQLDRLESQWYCASCSNYNYMDREVCNRCKIPPSANPPHDKITRSNDAFAVMTCIQTLKPSVDCEQFIRAGPNGEEEHDIVGVIKELENCVDEMKDKYNMPRHSAVQPQRRSTPAVHPSQAQSRYVTQAPPQQRDVSHGGGSATEWIAQKPGSWSCKACGNWNFADRTECNRCKAPNASRDSGRPIAKGHNPVASKPGSWECGVSDCGNWNFKDRVDCNKCKRPRAEVEVVA